MTINLRKCNFSELIDFITSIDDGELYNASIDTIVDKLYNDTWNYKIVFGEALGEILIMSFIVSFAVIPC